MNYRKISIKKLALFIILFSPNIFFKNIKAFKIDRVILATDANPDYIQFWPIVAKSWKEIVEVKPTLALIANKETKIDESLGDVIRFEPIDGIPTSFQAQVIRLLLPAYFENEGCIISDIDMIPLSKNYFIENVQNHPEDSFIIYRNNAYSPEEKKYPMCYLAASGKTFKEIFNIRDISDIKTLIKSFYELNLGWNTDELVLYSYINNWKKFPDKCVKMGHGVEKRIDRINWDYNSDLLKSGYYIDAHCPRPYSKYKSSIEDIFAYALKKEKYKIKKRFLENADYGTHMAPLLTCAINTTGAILEMGSGDFSTPLLHAICSKEKRFILTTDTDKKWLNNFIDLKTEWHDFQYVAVYEDDWSLNPKPEMWNDIATNKNWSVVLIDHRPGERRIEDIKRLRNNTEIFVVHDTQQSSYGYESVLNSFKYKYIYERYSTQTTIVSDTIDVSKFFLE